MLQGLELCSVGICMTPRLTHIAVELQRAQNITPIAQRVTECVHATSMQSTVNQGGPELMAMVCSLLCYPQVAGCIQGGIF